MTYTASQRMRLTMHFLCFILVGFFLHLFSLPQNFIPFHSKETKRKDEPATTKKIQLNEYELINIPSDSLQKYFTQSTWSHRFIRLAFIGRRVGLSSQWVDQVGCARFMQQLIVHIPCGDYPRIKRNNTTVKQPFECEKLFVSVMVFT